MIRGIGIRTEGTEQENSLDEYRYKKRLDVSNKYKETALWTCLVGAVAGAATGAAMSGATSGA